MSARPVTSDSTFASSVFPTPAGPSMSTGRPMRAARKITVEILRLAMYRASRNWCWTSSTESNMRAPCRWPPVSARRRTNEQRFILPQGAPTLQAVDRDDHLVSTLGFRGTLSRSLSPAATRALGARARPRRVLAPRDDADGRRAARRGARDDSHRSVVVGRPRRQRGDVDRAHGADGSAHHRSIVLVATTIWPAPSAAG